MPTLRLGDRCCRRQPALPRRLRMRGYIATGSILLDRGWQPHPYGYSGNPSFFTTSPWPSRYVRPY